MAISSALAVGGLAAGGLTSLIGSSMNMKASYAEAAALRTDGDWTYYDALMEAHQVQNEAVHFQESQAMKYVMSGVSLQGTPMQVLDYTANQAQMEIDHIKARGERQRELAYLKAGYMESGAKAQMLSSVGNTIVSVVSGISKAAQGGIFDFGNDANLDKALNEKPKPLKTGTKTNIEYGYTGNLAGLL